MLETANENNLNQDPRSGNLGKNPASAPIDEHIEEIITWTHALVGEDEIVQARELYFANNGKAFFDDSFYDARISYFFDQFIFEHRILGQDGGAPTTPFDLFVEAAAKSPSRFGAIELGLLRTIGRFRHSIFQIHKANDKQLVLADLLHDDRLIIEARPHETFRGLEKKQIIQAFVYRFGDLCYLSNGLMLHPQRANRILKKYLKTTKKAADFPLSHTLAKLAALNLRHLRHRHVDPKAIYQTGLK